MVSSPSASAKTTARIRSCCSDRNSGARAGAGLLTLSIISSRMRVCRATGGELGRRAHEAARCPGQTPCCPWELVQVVAQLLGQALEQGVVQGASLTIGRMRFGPRSQVRSKVRAKVWAQSGREK